MAEELCDYEKCPDKPLRNFIIVDRPTGKRYHPACYAKAAEDKMRQMVAKHCNTCRCVPNTTGDWSEGRYET